MEFDTYENRAASVQDNSLSNLRRGMLRALHMQQEPCAEIKRVLCPRGATYHVIVNLGKKLITDSQ
ncbi:dTDP-4-dehydrorhamnose 3,5-epimerase family protein [Solirubrum puertoriconensis]|uniref:dTDP-4-dehydrorhamnose 3,5-epimerase family protein n=1 Tax=Solirubrum puertoriconensis TaxID=1751427 RepID=UPI00098FB5D7